MILAPTRQFGLLAAHAFGCVAIIFAHGAAAATFYVATCGNDAWTGNSSTCSAPDGPKRHIQAAIDTSTGGDEIIVAAGTYSEVLNFKGKAIYLHSADGPDTTILKGRSTASTVTCTTGEGADTVLEGFTLTAGGGTAKRNNIGTNDYLGGGMYIASSSPSIRNCIFSKNIVGSTSIEGTNRGAGLYVQHGDALIANCTFAENELRVKSPGVTYGAGIYSEDSNPIVRNCQFSGNLTGNPGSGGGMWSDSGSPTIAECNFVNNGATYGWGGGLGLDYLGAASVTDCTFSSNGAGRGGGLFAYGGVSAVARCSFEENWASVDGGGQGGAVYTFKASATFRNCSFTDNIADSGNGSGNRGGAMYNAHCEVNATDCVFEANFAADDGGAIYNYSDNTIVLAGCIFLSNGAGFGDGGAVFSTGSAHVAAADCAFVYNGTPSFSYGGAMLNGGSTTLTNCTFAANESGHGGAAYNNYGGSATVVNCIFWGDTPNELDGELPDAVSFSDVEGGYAGEGNIDADPLFVRNPDPDNGDYGDLRLQSNSPCIDAGDPNYTPAPGETDLAGLFRVWDGNSDGVAVIDMGAYEFASFPYGDVNCDNAVDFNDIDAFVDALIDPDLYAANYPSCNILLADTDASGAVDFNDIDPFVTCLINNGCP